jgi:hypothetical protein
MGRGYWWNDNGKEYTESLGEKSVPLSLYPPHIPLALIWD